MPNDARYSRNEALFGQRGQQMIATARVGVVGTGGLGSHIAQQLSYLGVSHLVLVDPDVVTESSLNRLIGAIPVDVAEPKVEVIQRLCKEILPESSVASFVSALSDSTCESALSKCTSVISCLDDDGARLDLVEFCSRLAIPFFDLATDTGHDNGKTWFGGRILFSGNGERCPACMDLLDQRALARTSMSQEQAEVDRRIYGVEADSLAGSGPSVVSLNGIVASLAVMEWMVWTTGLRVPVPLLEYRGEAGGVFMIGDQPKPHCYYCSLWGTANKGDAA